MVVSSGVNYTCITGCSGVTPVDGANWMTTYGSVLSGLQISQLAAVGTPTFSTQGITTPVSGTPFSGGWSMISQSAATTTGYISQVQIYSSGSATITIFTATVSGLSATLVNSQTASVTSGLNTLTGLNIPITSGQYVGIYTTSGVMQFTTGGPGIWQVNSLVGTGTTVSATAGAFPEWNWTISQNPILTRLSADESTLAGVSSNGAAIAALQTTVGSNSVVQGVTSLASGSTPTGGNTYFSTTPVSIAGNITSFSAYFPSTGSKTIVVASLGVNGTLTAVQTQSISVAATGLQTITGLSIPVSVGQYVGIYASGSVVNYVTGSGGIVGLFTSGLTGTGTTLTYWNAAPQFNWTITPSLAVIPRVAADEAALASTTVATTNVGTQSPITGTNATTGATLFNGFPAPQSGTVTALTLYYPGSTGDKGTIVVATFNQSAGTVTVTASQTVGFVTGASTITGLSLPIAAGQLVGIYSAGAFKFAANGPMPTYSFGTSGLAGTGTAINAYSYKPTTAYQYGYTITSTAQNLAADTQATTASLNSTLNALNNMNIVAVGNSLTAGFGGTAYTTQLAALLPTNRTITNIGISAISMLGALEQFGSFPITLNVSSNTVPTSGSVSVTTAVTNAPMNNNGGTGIHGTLIGLNGTVTGTLTYTSATSSTTTMSFTRDSSGSAVNTIPGAQFIKDDAGYENQTVLLWAGRNSIGLQETTGLSSAAQLAQLQQATTAAVNYLTATHAHFLILSELNRTDEYAGSTTTVAGAALNGDASYSLIKQVNAWYQQQWPNNYVDVRSALVHYYDWHAGASGADTTAEGIDTIPPDLLNDALLHPNTTGYGVVAQAVYAALTRLSY